MSPWVYMPCLQRKKTFSLRRRSSLFEGAKFSESPENIKTTDNKGILFSSIVFLMRQYVWKSANNQGKAWR